MEGRGFQDVSSNTVMQYESQFFGRLYNFITPSLPDVMWDIIFPLSPPLAAGNNHALRLDNEASMQTSILANSAGVSSGAASGVYGSGSVRDTPRKPEKVDSPAPSGRSINPTSILRPKQLNQREELQKQTSAGSSGSRSSVTTVPCCTKCLQDAIFPCFQVDERDPLVKKEREVAFLKEELTAMRHELKKARHIVMSMQERENKLKERLAEQAQKILERTGNHFENITIGEKRPTALIRRYGNLYKQARVDALDALDSLSEFTDDEDLKLVLTFTVVVAAFWSVNTSVIEITEDIQEILQMPPPPPNTAQRDMDPLAQKLEEDISVYLRKTVDKYDLTKNVDEVCSLIWFTLFDYPCLKGCDGLIEYIKVCVRLAWGLRNQSPPYAIKFDKTSFRKDLHVRFHTSNQDSEDIKLYLWPILLEGENGPCVHKGVVVT